MPRVVAPFAFALLLVASGCKKDAVTPPAAAAPGADVAGVSIELVIDGSPQPAIDAAKLALPAFRGPAGHGYSIEAALPPGILVASSKGVPELFITGETGTRTKIRNPLEQTMRVLTIVPVAGKPILTWHQVGTSLTKPDPASPLAVLGAIKKIEVITARAVAARGDGGGDGDSENGGGQGGGGNKGKAGPLRSIKIFVDDKEIAAIDTAYFQGLPRMTQAHLADYVKAVDFFAKVAPGYKKVSMQVGATPPVELTAKELAAPDRTGLFKVNRQGALKLTWIDGRQLRMQEGELKSISTIRISTK